jgi:hypothetical protein
MEYLLMCDLKSLMTPSIRSTDEIAKNRTRAPNDPDYEKMREEFGDGEEANAITDPPGDLNPWDR